MAELRGPYAPDIDCGDADQSAVLHLLRSRKWREPFQRFQHKIGPPYESVDGITIHWRQRMWPSVAQLQGFESVASMQLGASNEFVSRLEESRARINNLAEPVTCYKIRNIAPVYDFPYMPDELFICSRLTRQARP
jgi:hypothetical protein